MARRSKSALPPLPDVAPGRKPRRLGLIGPFAVAGLAAIAWSVGWFYVSGETAKQMDLAAERFRAAGYQVSWDQRRIGGYPFRIDVTLDGARLRDPSGWGLSTPRLEAEAYMHALRHWVFATPDGLTFVRPLGGPVEVRGSLIHASLGDLDKTPPSFSLDAYKLTFTPAPGARPFALDSAERVQLHTRWGPNDEGAVFFRVDGGRAKLQGLFARVADGKPISMVWQSVLTKCSAFRGSNWSEAARAWAAGGGQVEVGDAGVTAGDALIGIQGGTLRLDPDGRLNGALNVSLRQAPKALSALADQGAIPQDAARAAAAVTAARTEGGDIARAPLTFEAGRVTLGPVALSPAPRLF